MSSQHLSPPNARHYPQELWFDIETLVSVAQPRSIALIGDIDARFLDNHMAQTKVLGQQCELHLLQLDDLDHFNARVDVAVVANVFEHIDKPTGARLISRLRDVLSAQFCISLPLAKKQDLGWQRNELFALGMQRVSSYQVAGQEFALFKYQLKDYKKTPDWLNADNWANPHMWGKYWW